MKEKINLLAKGVFEYENPEIVVSEEKIAFEVEAGKKYEGSFDVKSANGVEIRAMIFSSSKLMRLRTNDYIMQNIHVRYTFDATALAVGEIVEGHFSIISNGGEIEVPFRVTVCQPFCDTSIGPIRDLTQFTELAQANWHEAVKIFRTPNFERVFLVNKKYAHIYEMLVQSKNINQAMEEFLCTVKKKRGIEIHISQDSIEYEDLSEVISERLVIEKNQWGYQKLYISVVGDFIHVYKKELTTEDFLGSYYELEYIIDPAFFRYGNNYGKIIVRTVNQEIAVNVSCVKSYKSHQDSRRRSINESIYEIYDLFSKLQAGAIEKADWIRKTREAIDCCRNRSSALIYALYEAHFHILCDNLPQAEKILSGINGREVRLKSVAQYCYFLYLSALCREDESYTRFARDQIDGYDDSSYSSGEILWLKLKMSENIMPSRKYALIREQFERGCHSRLLYWEAIQAVNDNPSLLREFDDFEIQLIAWAARNHCVREEVADRFADIAVLGRKFSALALRTLIRLYETYQNRQMLSGIVALLIRGDRVSPEDHLWYRRGILSSLKNQGLYENYMRSLTADQSGDIPMAVLIYFNYDNQLSREQKAFLYAYVVEHREAHARIFRDYENIIKAFTHEQLGKGYINENMAVLYRYFIDKDKISAKVASLLPNVLFKREIIVDNPWITHVIVSHRDMEGARTYKIVDGRAYADIYMEDYYLIFVDRMECRYSGTIACEERQLLDTADYVRACAAQNVENPMVLLNRSERAVRYQKSDEHSIEIYKQTLRIPNVGRQFKKNILKNLIDFYYDNYEGETLEKYLLQLDISMLDSAERGNIIEYYIQRGLYDLAYEAVRDYGYDNIQDKKIMRLCSRKIRERNFEEDPLLREMAYYAFSCGKYDDMILEYLNKYYLGTTKEMYAIWVAARNFEVDAHELEGRLLCQMLFAETPIPDAFSVFASYYRQKPDTKIVRAFLAFFACKYVVRDEAVDDALFNYLEIEEGQMHTASDVCNLALLKYYARTEEQVQAHAAWIVPAVEKYMERGMTLPFFKAFAGLEQLPGEMLDRTYIAFRTNPKAAVTLCYKIRSGGHEPDAYTEEEMHNAFGGIFVKALTLFADERLEYYIREESGGQARVTGTTVVRGKIHKESGGRSQLDHMLTLAGEGRMEELREALCRYEKKRSLTKKLFTLIQ